MKRKLNNTDDAALVITDHHNVSKDDNQGDENINDKQEEKDEIDENGYVSDKLDDNDGVLERGEK